MRLKDKVAVVTGAAQGIGQAVAVRLASEGARKAIADLVSSERTRNLIIEAGGQCIDQIVDVSSPEQVQAFALNVQSKWGDTHVLVNNAGIYPQTAFEDISYEDWKRLFAINVDSQFLMAQALVPGMKRHQWGRIINISSASFWLNSQRLVNYVSTKAASIGFTHALAGELGAFGITVNAVAPSLVSTETAKKSPLSQRFDLVPTLQSIPLLQRPEDLGGVVAFLASQDAAFITGQVIAADGGLTRH